MPRFCVNENAQSNGDHEVHETNNCAHAPDAENQKDLGFHDDCKSAVKEAKESFSQSNGCYYCCEPCHTQ